MFNHTVLCIDDEPRILSAMQRKLRKEEYNLLTAADAREAMAILENQPVTLIISDHEMPGIKGLDFFSRIITRYPDVIRILLTGQADLHLALQAINEGLLFKFLLKPIDYYNLIFTIRSALNLYDLSVENRELNTSVKQQESILNALERKYPGITKRPSDGIYNIAETDQL